MKKVVLILIVVIGIVAAVFVFKKNSAIAPGPTESPAVTESVSPSPTVSKTTAMTPTTSPSSIPQKQTIIITFANGTAIPVNVTIRAGDTVKFINNDSIPRWPASGVHPTHQICPGFDSLRGLDTGESYSFTFNEAKTCPWHDHLKPSTSGKITVEQ